MFKRISGKAKLEWYPKTASTAISVGACLTPDGSGAVTNSSSTSTNILGISERQVLAADGDYATAGAKIPVDVLNDEDVFEADVVNTLTTAKVGTRMDLSDASTVNATGTSHNVVLCVGFISATKGLFKISARTTTLAGA